MVVADIDVVVMVEKKNARQNLHWRAADKQKRERELIEVNVAATQFTIRTGVPTETLAK